MKTQETIPYDSATATGDILRAYEGTDFLGELEVCHEGADGRTIRRAVYEFDTSNIRTPRGHCIPRKEKV